MAWASPAGTAPAACLVDERPSCTVMRAAPSQQFNRSLRSMKRDTEGITSVGAARLKMPARSGAVTARPPGQ